MNAIIGTASRVDYTNLHIIFRTIQFGLDENDIRINNNFINYVQVP